MNDWDYAPMTTEQLKRWERGVYVRVLLFMAVLFLGIPALTLIAEWLWTR